MFDSHPAVTICADIAVKFVTSSASRPRSLQIDFSPDAADLRKIETRIQFVMLVYSIYWHLNDVLAEKKVRSVSDLVDDLVTLVHQNQHFHGMQTTIRKLLKLTTPDTFAFETFCAQSRVLRIDDASPAARTSSPREFSCRC